MQMIFQSQVIDSGKLVVRDHDTIEGAKLVVDTAGSGSIVLFRRERNLPNCLPEYVLKSCSMWVKDDGRWHAIAIFTSGRRYQDAQTEAWNAAA